MATPYYIEEKIANRNKVDVRIPRPHPQQERIIASKSKRKVIRAGRRGGKTIGAGIGAMQAFLKGKRVLYTAPTDDQVQSFWKVVTDSLRPLIQKGILRKSEEQKVIEWNLDRFPNQPTKARIRAKTAWNADTLRGDYADLLIMDEFQLMNEDAWEVVAQPMLADNGGDCWFIYTPVGVGKTKSQAKDPRYARKLYQKAAKSATWTTFTFTSYENPHVNHQALNEMSEDMTSMAFRQEILAEDIDEIPGALWRRDFIEPFRMKEIPEGVDLVRISVGVDPTGSHENECGIVAGGRGTDLHGYILDDASCKGSTMDWGKAVIECCDRNDADRIVVEINYGGQMCREVLEVVQADKMHWLHRAIITVKSKEEANSFTRAIGNDENLVDDALKSHYDEETEKKIREYVEIYKVKNYYIKDVHASRGKVVRAQPVAARYEKGQMHHVGSFPLLEDEYCSWVPDRGDLSPNRLDAAVWTMTDLLVGYRGVGVAFG